MAAPFVLTAEIRLRAPNTRQVVRQMQSQLKGVNANINVNIPKTANAQMNKLNKNTKNVGKSMATAGKQTRGFATALKSTLGYLMRYDMARMVINAVTQTIRESAKAAVEFEREMVKVSQVTGKSMRSLRDLQNEISKLSTSLGVSSSSLVKTAKTLAQTGMTAKDTKIALEALAKTTLAPTFDDIKNTTETAIAALRQFGLEARQIETELGRINALAANFAVEASDLGVAIRRAGGAFKSAGGSLIELNALMTSVRSTTRETAETIATGFRTIFTRMQRPKTIQFLKQLGISLQDMQGHFVGPYEAVRRLNVALKDLDPRDVRYSQIIEQLGGFRQVSKVIPLIQQFGEAQKALAVATAGGNSLTKDAQTAQQALAVQLEKVREEFRELFRTLMSSKGFQSMIKMALDLSRALIKVVDALGPLIPMLTMMMAAKGAAMLGKGMIGRGRASGGRIHSFSGGGLVPGEGNRDTVPAMLAPGEFVIKKSSVKSLGVGTLARANRYAGGGPVVRSKKDVGMLVRKDSDKDPTDFANAQVSIKKVTQKGQVATLAKMVPGLMFKQGVDVSTFTSSEKFKKIAEEPINKAVRKAAGDLSRSSTKLKGRKVSGDKVEKRFSQGVGVLFENYVTALADVDKPGNKAFDLVGKQGAVDPYAKENIKHNTDLKLSSNNAAATDVVKKAVNQGLFANAISKRVQQEQKKKPVGKASGGSISGSGTDTVPAMLTPGEYVINRNSAARIGYGNLGRMNTFGKFAAGGRVPSSGKRYFGTQAGGGPRSPTMFRKPPVGKLHQIDLSKTPSSKTSTDAAKTDAKGQKAMMGMMALSMAMPLLADAMKTTADEATTTSDFIENLGSIAMIAAMASMMLGEKATAAAMKLNSASKGMGGVAAGAAIAAVAIGAWSSAVKKDADRQQKKIKGDLESGGFKDPLKAAAAEEKFKVQALRKAKADAAARAATWAAVGAAVVTAGAALVTVATAGTAAGPAITLSTVAWTAAIGAAATGAVALGAAAMTGTEAIESEMIEFASFLHKLNLGVSLQKFGMALKLISEGKSSPRAQAAVIAEGMQGLKASFASAASLDDVKDLNGEFQKMIPGMVDYITKLEGTTSSFAELQNIVGTKTLRQFAMMSGFSLEDLEKRIKQNIAVRKRATAAQAAQLAAMKLTTIRMRQANQALSAFETIETHLQSFDNQLSSVGESIGNTFGPAGMGQISDHFKNLANAIDPATMRDKIDAVATVFGKHGQSLGDELKEIAGVESVLPGVLIDAANEIGVGGARASDIIIDKLSASGVAISNATKRQIAARISSVADTGEGGEGKFAGKIKQDVNAVIKDLLKGLKGTEKVFQEAAKFIDNANKRMAKAFDMRAKLEFKIAKHVGTVLKLQQDNLKRVITARGGEIDEVGFGQANFNQQQRSMLRGTGVAGNINVGAVGREFNKLKDRIKESNARLAEFGIDPGAGQNLIDSQRALLSQNSKLKEQFAKTKQVLENYTNVQKRASDIQKQISREQAGRQAKLNAMTNFAFANDKGRLDIMKGFQATVIAVNKGLGAVPEAMRPAVMGVLDQFADLPVFAGKTGKQMKTDLTIKEMERVFGPMPAEMKKQMLVATNKEEGLIREMERIQKDAETAQMALLEGMKNDRKDLATQIGELHKHLIDGLSNIFLRQEEKELNQQLREAQSQTGIQRKNLAILNKLAAGGLPVKNPAMLEAMRNNIDTVKAMRDATVRQGKFIRAGGKRDLVSGFTGFEEGAKGTAMRDIAMKNLNRLGDIQDELMRAGVGADMSAEIVRELKTRLDAIHAGAGEEGMTAAQIQKELQEVLKMTTATGASDQQKIIDRSQETLKLLGLDRFSGILMRNVDMIAGAFAQLPPEATFRSLTNELNLTVGEINRIRGQLRTNQGAQAGQPAPALAGGGVRPFAAGGFAPRGTDTVPAMLTPGEFVVNRSATSRNRGTLEAINSGQVNYLAGGGIIGGPHSGFSYAPLEQSANKIVDVLTSTVKADHASNHEGRVLTNPRLWSKMAGVPVGANAKTSGYRQQDLDWWSDGFLKTWDYNTSHARARWGAWRGFVDRNKTGKPKEWGGKNHLQNYWEAGRMYLSSDLKGAIPAGGGTDDNRIAFARAKENTFQIITNSFLKRSNLYKKWHKDSVLSLAKDAPKTRFQFGNPFMLEGKDAYGTTVSVGENNLVTPYDLDKWYNTDPHAWNLMRYGNDEGDAVPWDYRRVTEDELAQLYYKNYMSTDVPWGAYAQSAHDFQRNAFSSYGNFYRTYASQIKGSAEKLYAGKINPHEFGELYKKKASFKGFNERNKEHLMNVLLVNEGNNFGGKTAAGNPNNMIGNLEANLMNEPSFMGGGNAAATGYQKGFGRSYGFLNGKPYPLNKATWPINIADKAFPNAFSKSLKVREAKYRREAGKLLDLERYITDSRIDEEWEDVPGGPAAMSIPNALSQIAALLGSEDIGVPVKKQVKQQKQEAAVKQQADDAEIIEKFKQKAAIGGGKQVLNSQIAILKGMATAKKFMLDTGFRHRVPHYTRLREKGLHRLDPSAKNAKALFPFLFDLFDDLKVFEQGNALKSIGAGGVEFDHETLSGRRGAALQQMVKNKLEKGKEFKITGNRQWWNALERMASVDMKDWYPNAKLGGEQTKMMDMYFGKQWVNNIDSLKKTAAQTLTNLGGRQKAAGMASGGVVGFANGGSVFTPQGTDTVPAMLTPGEFVVSKSAVDAIGVGYLNAINNSKKAAGGKASGTQYLHEGGIARESQMGYGGDMDVHDKFARSISLFSGQIEKLSKALAGGFDFNHSGNITITVRLDETASIFEAAQGSFEAIAGQKVAQGINDTLRTHFPDLPRAGSDLFS